MAFMLPSKFSIFLSHKKCCSDQTKWKIDGAMSDEYGRSGITFYFDWQSLDSFQFKIGLLDPIVQNERLSKYSIKPGLAVHCGTSFKEGHCFLHFGLSLTAYVLSPVTKRSKNPSILQHWSNKLRVVDQLTLFSLDILCGSQTPAPLILPICCKCSRMVKSVS